MITRILIVGSLVLCFSSQGFSQSPFGTPNAMIWQGMPYGNPALWGSQLTHKSQYSTGSNIYDPSIERARIDNDYHRAETYWKKKELWKKHNPPKPRAKYVRKPFDPDEVYAGNTVFWPVVFRDTKFSKYKSKIEKILGFTGEREWKHIQDFNDSVAAMEKILRSNSRAYPANYYGEAKVFLRDLKRSI